MFGLFKTKAQQKESEPRSRGVQPTYVTDDSVVLCKASPTIRNAYEIRLALFMASTRKARFILVVRPGAKVEPGLRAHLEAHGGTVQEREFADYSVYVGHLKASGDEGDGWVLGDAGALSAFHNSLASSWCNQKFVVGSSLCGDDLAALERELNGRTVSQTNIDQENIRDALLALSRAVRADGGTLFIQ